MKKIMLTLCLVLFVSSAYALRDAGMKAHDSGDHAKSEKLLNDALALFKS